MSQDDAASVSPRRARGRPRGWEDKTEQNTIKSLDRAIEVLDYLSAHQGQSLSALSTDLGQSPATVYRILTTLEGRRFVEFDAGEQLWYLGPQAFIVGARFLRRTSLVERARPIMWRLMEATGETANLGIVRGDSVLFVSQVETHANIRAFFPPGTLSPLHASGIGKALLAEMPEARRLNWLQAAPLERFTDNTLTDRTSLLADLDTARLRGYALDREERNVGMRCIAAPVFNFHGEAIAGISVSGPTSRISDAEIPAMSLAVRQAAEELTHALGGDRLAPSEPSQP